MGTTLTSYERLNEIFILQYVNLIGIIFEIKFKQERKMQS